MPHTTHVTPIIVHRDGLMVANFSARCSCGWMPMPFTTEQQAKDRAVAHTAIQRHREAQAAAAVPLQSDYENLIAAVQDRLELYAGVGAALTETEKRQHAERLVETVIALSGGRS
jgi:hypothetical protein